MPLLFTIGPLFGQICANSSGFLSTCYCRIVFTKKPCPGIHAGIADNEAAAADLLSVSAAVRKSDRRRIL